MATRASTNGASGTQGAHPAPARARTGIGALAFGLFGAPAAWSVQTLVNLPLSSHACYPALQPLSAPVVAVRGLAFAVSVAVLIVSAAAAAVACRSWMRTRHEHHGATGKGTSHDPRIGLMETGEGRTRFMALGGMVTSAIFLLVALMHTITIGLVIPCQ